jgi:hypothetical protein
MTADPTSSRTYTIPDAGASGSFVMTAGSNLSSGYTTGDILYASATNTLSKLAIGTSGQVLTVSGGIPAWGSGVTSGTTTNSTLRYNGTSWVENTNVLSTSDGTLTVKATSNQLVLNTGSSATTIHTAPSASRTYTIPDAGANASFVMTEGSQTINGTKTIGGIVVASPGSLGTLTPSAAPSAFTSFSKLYHTATVSASSSGAQYIKLPTGSSDGQIVYLKLSFTDATDATKTVTVKNSDGVNTGTMYDGVGADVFIMHMIYDNGAGRWLILSSNLMP